MGYQTNFDLQVTLTATHLLVSGSAEGIEAGDLIARTVAIQQGDSFAAGLVTPGLGKWEGEIGRNGATFEAGDCTAIGTDLYALHPDENPDAIGTTLTETWVQTIPITLA